MAPLSADTQQGEPVLPPNAARLAEQIGVAPKMRRVLSLAAERRRTGLQPGAEELISRQGIFESVLAASLDVDSVTAEIDNESSQLAEVSSVLQSRRDNAVNTTTIANIIIGTGLGIVGTAMQLSSRTAQLGNGIGVAAGSTSTALQMYSLHQQSGATASVGRVPNMLAPLFHREGELNSAYPADVWRYLNSVPSGLSTTRLDGLKQEWLSAGRIDSLTPIASSKEIELLTAGTSQQRKLGIDVLSNRQAMLADVRGRVMLMKRDLADLLRSIQAMQ